MSSQSESSRCAPVIAILVTCAAMIAIGAALLVVAETVDEPGVRENVDGARTARIPVPKEEAPTNGDLIESFATLDRFGMGCDPWVDTWSGAIFVASDHPADFTDSYPDLQDFDPPMQELVARGVDALPELLAHLDDPRATSIGATVMWEATERYSGRPDQDRRWLAAMLEVVTEFDERCEHSEYWFTAGEYVDEHWVTIGDLCYVAIGQIVSRDYQIFITGGSNSGAIMSPTANPELADALRKEWSGLTAERHLEILVNEALHSQRGFEGNPRVVNAVKRLCHYYPETGERVLQQLLSRDLCDEHSVFDFAYDELLNEQDPIERRFLFERHLLAVDESEALGAVLAIAQKLDSVQEQIDEAEAAVRLGTGLSSNGKPLPNEEQYAERDLVLAVYQESVELIGGTDRLTTVAGFWEQDELIRATLNFRSPAIDELTRRIAAQAKTFNSNSARWLIETCRLRASRDSGDRELHQ